MLVGRVPGHFIEANINVRNIWWQTGLKKHKTMTMKTINGYDWNIQGHSNRHVSLDSYRFVPLIKWGLNQIAEVDETFRWKQVCILI